MPCSGSSALHWVNPSLKKTKILDFNHCCISYKTPYIIYADLESLIGKIGGCRNNPEKLSKTKVS